MSTWIFLRGLTRERRHWGGFPEDFRQAVPGARVHLPDLPGNGTQNGERSPLSVEAMAEACRAELRRQGIAPPYHLLALSLGAMVALAWAARHPGEIAACVLINTSARPFAPFYRRLRPSSYLRLLGVVLPAGAREREAHILRLTSRAAPPAGLLDAWAAYRRENPVSAANALRQLLAAARYRVPARPDCPVLVLASRNDALVHPLCSRRLAAQWGAAYAEHPGAGHDLPLDDGPWVAKQVGEWLHT